LFFADKFEGKIPVPPIQELFELEPNIQTKRSRKEGGRVRCMLTVVDRGIQVSAEASSHKAAKSAAARAALKKIKAQT